MQEALLSDVKDNNLRQILCKNIYIICVCIHDDAGIYIYICICTYTNTSCSSELLKDFVWGELLISTFQEESPVRRVAEFQPPCVGVDETNYDN